MASRGEKPRPESRKLGFGVFCLDFQAACLYRDQDVVQLSPKAFAVLRTLAAQAGQVVTKEALLDAVWPEANVGEAVLTVAIRELRLALGDPTRTPRFIATVHRQGYRFIAPVTWVSSVDVQDQSQAGKASAFAAMGHPGSYIERAHDFDQLWGYVQAAIAGQPRVVWIEGEAGIGKTRLLREFQARAQLLAIHVCFGRCAENLSLPYLPLVESLLAYLEHAYTTLSSQIDIEVDIEAIRWLYRPREMPGTTASEGGLGQGDQNRLRLFLAVSRATIELAQHHPLCLLLDDLHWADSASLELFEHVVLAIADAAAQRDIPLLVAATSRPPERGSHLFRFWSRFRGERVSAHMVLKGFDEADLLHYVQSLALGRPSNQLIAMLSSTTQGNPLFVQELMQYLVRTDALEARQGTLVTRVSPDNLQLPEHVTGILLAYLDRLSPTTWQILVLASVLGHRFELPLLSAVSNVSEDDLLDALEEAMQQRLLLSEGQSFEFQHPLMRHVVYNAASETRRQRLHYRLAQTLERLHADQLNAHSMEIAHHLINAGELVKPLDVLTYARQAGAQALAAFAWIDAARYFEAALEVAVAHGHVTAADRADLHYRAGYAYQRAADAGPSMDHYDRAVEAYRDVGDVRGMAQALLDKTRTQLTLTGAAYGTLIDATPLHDALEALGDRDLGLRGHIAAMMADIYCYAQEIDRAEEMAQYALAVGQQLGDDGLCSRASCAQALLEVQGRQRVKDALQGWKDAHAYARRAHDLWQQATPLPRMALTLTMLGELDEAESVAREAWTLSRTLQSWGNGSLVLASLTAIHVMRGEFDQAEEPARESLIMASRSGFATGSSRAHFTLAGAFAQRGVWEQAATVLAMQVEPGRLFVTPSASLSLFVEVFGLLLRAYQDAGLETDLPSLADQLNHTGNPEAHPLSIACAMAELGDFAADPVVAGWGAKQLAKAEAQAVVFTTGWVFLVPRILGIVAALKQEWTVAEAYFQSALAVARQTGAQPELARTYLDYARMLFARGEADRAEQMAEWVRQATPMFDQLGMLPFARRAKRLMDAGSL